MFSCITNQKPKTLKRKKERNLFRPQKKSEFGMAEWLSFRKNPTSAQT